MLLARLLAAAVLLAMVAAAPAMARANPMRCNGEAALCDRPFDRTVLPATHNAMSARALGWQLPNQQLSIPDQLRLGIRGFLIDTYYAHRQPDGVVVNDPVKTPTSDLYVCHVLCQLGATPLVDVLQAMRDHLRAEPDSVLAVINEDSIAPVDFRSAVRRSGLRRHVYRGRPGPRWPTLRQMIRSRRQVVMLAERDSGTVPWYHEAYSGIVQETPYTFATPELLTDPAQWEASCRPNRGGTTGSLFLMNHWSPPFAPSPATSAVVNAAATIVGRALTCARVRGRLPTLVAVDMFPAGGLLEAVRWLNALPYPSDARVVSGPSSSPGPSSSSLSS
jgi:hypothetical protein